MIPLGILGQFYFMSMVVGGAFIAINLFTGNLSDGDGTDGGDAGADGGTSTSGDDFGAAGGDASSGDDFGAGSSADGSPNGDDFGASNSGKLITTHLAQTNVVAGLHHHAMGNRQAPVMPDLPRRIGSLILSLLSPMSLALFLAFFGVFGLACAKLYPQIGIFSLLPAILGSMAVSKLFKAIIRYLIVQGNVSTEAKVADLVGQIGQVNTPISEGRPGEITYVIGSKLYSSAAKPYKQGVEFKRGSKVWIAEVQDHVLLVEACDEADAQLLQTYPSRR